MFSLAIPIAAVFFFSSYHRKQVRREVKHHIMAITNRDELVLLKFSDEQRKAELQWKHSKEFKFQEQMYDVVEAERRGDTTYYWCWWDHEETRLNKKLDQLLAAVLGSDPVNRDNQKQLVQIYKSLYCEKQLEWDLMSFQNDQEIPKTYCFHFGSLVFPPPVPPPDFA